MNKIINLIIVAALFCLPAFSQEPSRPLGLDLTYSSILKTNKIGSRAWIRKWLASGHRSPTNQWISEWRGEPIISSILIEYAGFSHAGEHCTMWLSRTKNRAYFRQWIEGDEAFGDIQNTLDPPKYENLLGQMDSWQQGRPVKPRKSSPQSLPGYLGFLSIYKNEKSRQMLLSEEDFGKCVTKKCKGDISGRLMVALRPILLRDAGYAHKSEAELTLMPPAQKVDEFFKERLYHLRYFDKQEDLLRNYLFKDGAKALPALADIANRFNPDDEWNDEQLDELEIALSTAVDINNRVIRIRETEEGRSAIKVFEDVLDRMKKAGFADGKHKWNHRYLYLCEWIRTLQGQSA